MERIRFIVVSSNCLHETRVALGHQLMTSLCLRHASGKPCCEGCRCCDSKVRISHDIASGDSGAGNARIASQSDTIRARAALDPVPACSLATT
jgi:hypothetical protein